MEQARQSEVTVDVDQLAVQITQLAASRRLAIVPAMPLANRGSGCLVLLDNDDLSAPEFCELASAANARLLYVQTEGFYAGTDPDLDLREQDRSDPDRAVSAQLAELRRDAERFNGRFHQLGLAFAAGGVLHCWTVTADWYDGLVDRAAELLPCEDLETECVTGAGE